MSKAEKPDPPAQDAAPGDDTKQEEKPEPKKYTPEEIEEIARKVENPADNTPAYRPTHVLSPEFNGASNYEMGVSELKKETEQRLAELQKDPGADPGAIRRAEEDLKTISHLHENYNLGMNVFRTAKGGRDKLRA